jgi:acyl-CoA synthetase (AMP-forming)/AMP-acid ligase II
MVGVIAGGRVAVPVPPAGLSKRDQRWTDFVTRVYHDCDAALVTGREGALPTAAALGCVPTRSFAQLLAIAAPSAELELPTIAGDEIAILQYTSGTTSSPRAVALTHDNVLANLASMERTCEMTPEDVGMMWLPLFHDMGLIGGLLNATHAGISLVVISPRSFQMRPEAWLWAISRFRATCTAAPNSAYHICATQVSAGKLAGLELSSLRFACCGAELVQPETV